MRKYLNSTDNIFTGIWRLTEIHAKIMGGWLRFKCLEGPAYIWRFHPENNWVLSSGEIIFEGQIECDADSGVMKPYIYVPDCGYCASVSP